MPSALLRACSWPGGCGNLVKAGRCEKHERTAQKLERNASARGYDWKWQRFCRAYDIKIVRAGLIKLCGARLPGAPQTNDSECAAKRILNDGQGKPLHHDHIEPHRGDEAKRIDPLNIQLLCVRCHGRKSAQESAK